MESQFDTTGIITKISHDSCIVSIAINDEQRSFSFSKHLLYACGLQCEGLMTNILDEGMEVDVRYTFTNDEKPYVIAVWLFEKPSHLTEDPSTLKSCYDQSGYVIDLKGDNVLVQNANANHTVLINKEVFFRNDFVTKNGSGLTIGEKVTFDAIPFESSHPTGASHQATCAWVGRAPRLLERFGLHILASLDDSWDIEDGADVVHGTVAVIPNEVVAFAELESVHQNGKVLLFRQSFVCGTGCDNVRNVVSVGDRLCMQVRYDYIFSGNKQWFALRAWKDGGEVPLDGASALEKTESCSTTEENDSESQLSTSGETYASATQIRRGGHSVVKVSEGDVGVSFKESCSNAPPSGRKRIRVRGRKRIRVRGRKSRTRDEDADDDLIPLTRESPAGTIDIDSDESLQTMTGHPDPIFDVESEVLVQDPPLSGFLSLISLSTASIRYGSFNIFVDRKVIFYNGLPITDTLMYLWFANRVGKCVFFEAVKTNSKNLNPKYTYEATCVWIGSKPPNMMTPKRALKTEDTKPSTSLQPKVKDEGVKSDKTKAVLCGDPPLSGAISLASKNTACISYNGLKIYVTPKKLYIDGQKCEPSHFVLMLTTKIQRVNFEAEEDSRALLRMGYTHRATCAWVGKKPCLDAETSKTPPLLPDPAPKSQKPVAKQSAQTSKKSTAPVVEFNEASDVLLYDPPLTGVLSLIPRLHLGANDLYMTCIRYGKLKIGMDSELYIDGKLATREKFEFCLSLSASVNFEAVKTVDPEMTSEGVFHVATCAWIGPKPSLTLITQTLPAMEFSLLEEEHRTYVGVVRKLCLPKVALAVVEQYNTTVCVHVSAFGRKPPKEFLDYVSGKSDCISKFVKINDKLEFKVGRVPMLPKILGAYNVKILSGDKGKTTSAGRVSVSESAPGESVLQHENTLSSGEEPSSKEAFSVSCSYSELSTPLSREIPASVKVSNEETEGTALRVPLHDSPQDFALPHETISGIVYKLVQFKPLKLPVMHKWFLNCLGILEFDTKLKVVTILPFNFTIDYSDTCTALQGLVCPPDEKRLTKFNGKDVWFDAVKENAHTRVTLVWEATNPRPEYPHLKGLGLELDYVPHEYLRATKKSIGKIKDIPSHDCAIAVLDNGLPVLIRTDSLVTAEDINPTTCSIDNYLRVDDSLCVEADWYDFPYKDPLTYKQIVILKAERCWKVIKLRDSSAGDQVEGKVCPKKSWSNIWKFGHCFKKGKLKREHDQYVVPYKASRRTDITLALPRKCFLIDRKLTIPPDGLDGQDVTFHVAHEDANDPSSTMFIQVAWIGKTPTAEDILMDRLAVPDGVASRNSYYEGVVENFPLPTHAICRIGAVPVLVNRDSPKCRISADLVEGMRVSLRVLDVRTEDGCLWESNETCQMKMYFNVFTNMCGTVSCLPSCQGGKIKSSIGPESIEVDFDLAVVQIPEGLGLTKTDVFEWFEYLNKHIKIGTPVTFTAVKTNNKEGKYRAYRVWVEGTSSFSGSVD